MTPGIVLIVLGVALGGWALGRFRRAGTSPIPRVPVAAFVPDGPYRFTRNPMYVGFGLVFLGGALWVNSLWLLVLLVVALFVVQQTAILREERYLERKFGVAYTEYKARVRRWV